MVELNAEVGTDLYIQHLFSVSGPGSICVGCLRTSYFVTCICVESLRAVVF